MAKTEIQTGHDEYLPRRKRTSVVWQGTAVLSLIFLVLWTRGLKPRISAFSGTNIKYEEGRPAAGEFDFDKAPSRPYLDYAKCFGGKFECARLEIQMDHFNGSTNATISLAVIRSPATVLVTDHNYGGAILLNPGGPGGSGVKFALRAAESLRHVVDGEDGKSFDLVSFDPRGVGATRPLTSTYLDAGMRQSFQIRTQEDGILGSSDAALGRLWSMAAARGQSVALPVTNTAADLKKYMATSYVAADMVSLVEAHGAWREKEAARIIASDYRRSSGSKNSPKTAIPEHIKYRVGEEKIQYWGFSYGTLLGQTFAAMFPGRVKRVILDGVVDPYDYRKALWYDNLVDSEKTMGSLFDNCARVGWPACPLARKGGDTTSHYVRQRIQNITKSLYHNPLPVVGPYPEIIEYSDVRNFIAAALYKPIEEFPRMATLLAEVEHGNGTNYAKRLRESHSFDCSANNDKLKRGSNWPDDAQMQIACTDGDDQSFLNRSSFAQYINDLEKLSPTMGPVWATIRLSCIHYSVRAKFRFESPFEGSTSHPLLFLGNTADPVTPGRYAIAGAARYSGAVALLQDSPGHCTISAPSSCTAQYIRKYLRTGELPPKNTTCAVDARPWDKENLESSYGVDTEARELQYAIAEINTAMYSTGGGFGSTGTLRDV